MSFLKVKASVNSSFVFPSEVYNFEITENLQSVFSPTALYLPGVKKPKFYGREILRYSKQTRLGNSI